MQILGISGKAGSGKDFIADNILGPLGFRRWSLAWHFKVWLSSIGKCTYEEAYHTKPPQVRSLLQRAGDNDSQPIYGHLVWCRVAHNWMRCVAEHWGVERFVIPDVRYKHEVAFIQRVGGKVLRIAADSRVSQNKLTPEQRLHRSEIDLDDCRDFDGIIDNEFRLATWSDGSETQIHVPVSYLDGQVRMYLDKWGWSSGGNQQQSQGMAREAGGQARAGEPEALFDFDPARDDIERIRDALRDSLDNGPCREKRGVIVTYRYRQAG